MHAKQEITVSDHPQHNLPARPKVQNPGRAVKVASGAMLAIAIVFGLINVPYPWWLLHSEPALSIRLIGQVVSPDFVRLDPATLATAIHSYTRAFAGISIHMVMGSLALASCALQFVPSLRRRWPRAHRIVGYVAVSTTAASMAGAMLYLYQTPGKEVFTGEPFKAALWALALSTLFSLCMAMKTILQRNVRAHMGWMATVFASLLTAPLLRIEYPLVAWLMPTYHLTQANAALVPVIGAQAFWLMAWWMLRVGQADVPLLAPQWTLPQPAWRFYAAVGMISVLHEGVLAPWGLDLLGHWRAAHEHLPTVAAAWALPMLVLLPGLPKAAEAVIDGKPVPVSIALSGLTASIGAGLMLLALPASSHNEISRLFYWGGTATLGLAVSVAALAGTRQAKALAPMRMLGLMSWLAPAVWPLTAAPLSLTGWSVSAIWTTALTLSSGFVAFHGFASAFGLTLPGSQRPAAAIPKAMAHPRQA